MRWILRILLIWVVLGLLGYFFGLPYAATYLEAKTKNETLAQCEGQLQHQHLVGGANAPLTADQGTRYCHCLADPLVFTRADILSVMHDFIKTHIRHAPVRLTQQIQLQVEACNVPLQEAITARSQTTRAVTIPTPSKPGSETIIMQ